jgi:hypothetical protein
VVDKVVDKWGILLKIGKNKDFPMSGKPVFSTLPEKGLEPPHPKDIRF